MNQRAKKPGGSWSPYAWPAGVSAEPWVGAVAAISVIVVALDQSVRRRRRSDFRRGRSFGGRRGDRAGRGRRRGGGRRGLRVGIATLRSDPRLPLVHRQRFDRNRHIARSEEHTSELQT